MKQLREFEEDKINNFFKTVVLIYFFV